MRVNPHYINARNNLASIHFDRGEYAESLQHLERVVHRVPEEVTARLRYGITLRHLGRPLESAEQLQQTLEMIPRSVHGRTAHIYLVRDGRRLIHG